MVTRNRSRNWHGWSVVIAVTIVLTATSGARFLYGVVLKPVSEEFGWSRTDLTGAVLVNMLLLSAFQPCIGAVVDRFGSKKVAAAAAVFSLKGVGTYLPRDYRVGSMQTASVAPTFPAN